MVSKDVFSMIWFMKKQSYCGFNYMCTHSQMQLQTSELYTWGTPILTVRFAPADLNILQQWPLVQVCALWVFCIVKDFTVSAGFPFCTRQPSEEESIRFFDTSIYKPVLVVEILETCAIIHTTLVFADPDILHEFLLRTPRWVMMSYFLLDTGPLNYILSTNYFNWQENGR